MLSNASGRPPKMLNDPNKNLKHGLVRGATGVTLKLKKGKS
jgi:hypothetical protein